MEGGEVENILQRIERAMGRIDAATRDSGRDSGGPGDGAGPALKAENARLREAVTSAMTQIDALLAEAEAPDAALAARAGESVA